MLKICSAEPSKSRIKLPKSDLRIPAQLRGRRGELPEQIMAESSAARPNPNEKLVRVFDTQQESEALVVRGLLESAGIDSDVTSLDAQQAILPGDVRTNIHENQH